MRRRGDAVRRAALALLLAVGPGSCSRPTGAVGPASLASLLDDIDAAAAPGPDALDLDVGVIALPGELAERLRAPDQDGALPATVTGGSGGCGRPGWTRIPPFAIALPRPGSSDDLRDALAALDASGEVLPIARWRERAGRARTTLLEHDQAVPYRVVMDEGAEIRHLDTRLAVTVTAVGDESGARDALVLDLSLAHELPSPACQVEGQPPLTVPERVDARIPLRPGQIAVLGASLGLIGFERFAGPWVECVDPPRLLVLVRPRLAP